MHGRSTAESSRRAPRSRLHLLYLASGWTRLRAAASWSAMHHRKRAPSTHARTSMQLRASPHHMEHGDTCSRQQRPPWHELRATQRTPRRCLRLRGVAARQAPERRERARRVSPEATSRRLTDLRQQAA